MNNRFSIRTAKTSDAIELKELFQNTVLAINRRDYPQEEVEDWASCGEDISHIEAMINEQHFIVAVNHMSQIVGFASITPQGYLHNMFVHSDFQRMGIATMLLKEIERHAEKMTIRKLTSEVSLTALLFFKKNGFTVAQQQKRKANKLYLTNFIMTKEMPVSRFNPHSDEN